jgi:hypothetical protein
VTLRRSGSGLLAGAARLLLYTSARSVELFVQQPMDRQPSYAALLRGEPCAVAHACARTSDGGPAPGEGGGDAGRVQATAQLFSVDLSGFHDWRLLRLRLRPAAGDPSRCLLFGVCCVPASHEAAGGAKSVITSQSDEIKRLVARIAAGTADINAGGGPGAAATQALAATIARGLARPAASVPLGSPAASLGPLSPPPAAALAALGSLGLLGSPAQQQPALGDVPRMLAQVLAKLGTLEDAVGRIDARLARLEAAAATPSGPAAAADAAGPASSGGGE